MNVEIRRVGNTYVVSHGDETYAHDEIIVSENPNVTLARRLLDAVDQILENE